MSSLPVSRLRLLLPMLSSDQDGEVIATARAIGRALKDAGRDWHDLAAAIGPAPEFRPPSPARRPAPAKPKRPRPTPWSKLSPAARSTWLAAILNDVSFKLKDRECRTVEKVLALIRAGGTGAPKTLGKDTMNMIRSVYERAFAAGVTVSSERNAA